MDPNSAIYKKIYNDLGEDFRSHLKAGDLHLYKMNAGGEFVKKNCCYGRVWARLSKKSAMSASAEIAKKIITDRFNTFQRAKNNFHYFSSKSANITDFTKVSALFEFAKVEAAQNWRGVSKHLANYHLNQEQRFEIARIAAENSRRWILDIIDYDLNHEQRFEIAKIIATKHADEVPY
ncbi:MAG: hypothetical protein H0X29_09680, partial [Parachlamydiaceae bacterium]|nr:hypothetical protein [Parachlamydiaceae bacterium]